MPTETPGDTNAYARDADGGHLPAWKAFTRRVGEGGDVGIRHGTFLVRDGEDEAVDNDMPPAGLGDGGEVVPAPGRAETAGAVWAGPRATTRPSTRTTDLPAAFLCRDTNRRSMWHRRTLLAAAAAAAGLGGCAESSAPATPEGPTGAPSRPPVTARYAFTHLRADGNRVVDGRGTIDDAQPVDIVVDGRPAWLLAFGGSGGASYWTVVTAGGRATTHRVGDRAETVASHGRVPTPPLAYAAGGAFGVVDAPADCAAETHPVMIDGGVLYVATNGDAVVRRDGTSTRLDADAPSDARPVRVDDGRYALYGGRTERYRHGALGDGVEGSRLLVVDAAGERVEASVTLDAPAVFEGLSPLVADLDGDGDAEIVTTVADATDGARIRAYDVDGAELATGPSYGSGWRHQLCVAPFAPDGRPELAVVRKPHVDRTLEFYRLDDDGLTVTATHGRYASHTYGSRNVDGGLAADLHGDGRSELLLPTADRRALAAVRRASGGVERASTLPLGGSLATNVVGVALDDGRLAVGAGTTAGVRIWRG